MKSRIDSAPRHHPRLFLTRGEDKALRRKIDADPLLRDAFAYVTTSADAIGNVPPVERKKIGRRLLGVSRTCLKRVLYLAFAHRLTGDTRYAVRAQEEMLAAAAFTDWNPSHFLDVSEMTAALAIGYDWLYDVLDPEARRTIRDAIVQKGLVTSLKGGWWVRTENNWNQVCHGGLTLGALAVLEDEPKLAAQIIERAIENLPRAMAQYAPDGAYPEGPGYWKYGTTYNVILIAALESVLGTDFGLPASDGFLKCADYYQHATGPTGLFFNYSDCSTRGGVAPAMYWFAAKRQAPSLLWRERHELDRFLCATKPPDPAGSANRMFPFLLVWAGARDEHAEPEIRHWKADGVTPVAMLRSGWDSPDATFVGIKGGSPGANHAHMDVGSFVMDALGVRWAEDLGSQSYHSLESKGIKLWGKKQDSQRWDVFRLNSLSHNTLVVDGKKQQVKGHSPIIAFSDQAPMPHTIVDLTPVYTDQLASAKRGIGLRDDRSVLIRDELETLDRQTTIRWGMVTRAEVTIEDEHHAILRRGDQQLSLSIQTPTDARLQLFETAQPPKAHDAPNKGTRMIGFELERPPSTESTLVVVLTPGNGERAVVDLKELTAW